MIALFWNLTLVSAPALLFRSSRPGHGRKVEPGPGTPGPLEPLEPPGPWDLSTSGSHGLPEPPGPLDPRTPGDLRTSGPFGNYLYHLKFRI